MPQPSQSETTAKEALRRFLLESFTSVTDASVTGLVSGLAGQPLGGLDELEHWIRSEIAAVALRPPRNSWWRRPARVRHLSWLDLSNADGRAREQALRSLPDGAPSSLLFALALRRLNDWVPQVRAAAREQLPAIALRSDPAHVADALWTTLLHAGSWGRMTRAERNILEHLAATEAVTLHLKERILRATAGPAATLLVQVARTPTLDPWLGEIASKAIQPAVRARAYRYLLEGRAAWVEKRTWVWTDLRWCEGKVEPVIGERLIEIRPHFAETLRSALADTSPLVRRVAAELLIKHLDSMGDEGQDLAAKLAMDPATYVAERGRFAMAKLDGHYSFP